MLIANILGIFVFFYLYWKRLKEDYSSERIFNAGFIIIIGACLGLIVAKYNFPSFWLWIIILSFLISEGIIVIKLKLKFFESLDALVISILPWLSFFYLTDSVVNTSLASFLIFWVSLTCIFMFFLFDHFYRTFTWYKSGRVGFSGLATLGIFFLIKILFPSLFVEKIISGTIAFISFLLLFNLSRQDG
ncbi:MAG: hypothetical protein UR39_C0002G0121 [Candidatus Woesebacteria bacterium GW2011_GWA1_33_30]|uniref:Uncharacterized protein n=1 Tax=Candidatus Woesebacteria bacterium GW2011_GWA2_33_28 TaxID=1618561 RepID=A0A0F9ZUH0_9BACT|nr:MAG: hypothetical protein UR38_C0002G0121 [Candidatus Woesebacteria bacterium GW2011_GWA2_33_28]KKP48831.1 MAG: hypothetical protein UR39_C0002G0121 [Candidatus Woesebacteria bacterium GW2011_GWA1_33_30]KKP50104.1 MAG: hypothetical protein UR40_C0002G0121 [Microgenomates group bacterium GW2011_GWC1_33_32]KKP51875.1 MAG: hypothetical protein UR44_C0006G0121 [Candidatus Woesebacteria bacterium GW2011_GWB1_33_38]KKP56817.1 MAG: hypothetical protein UR48_C0028G0010 [Microgenomates group bacteriu